MHTQAQVARRPEEGIGVPASGLHVVVSHPTWASVTVDWFYANLTEAEVIGEEGASVKKMPP